MDRIKPERAIDSQTIEAQHNQIIDGINALLGLVASGTADDVKRQYTAVYELVVGHFRDEENVLDEIGSDLLAVQRAEHAFLARLMAHMGSILLEMPKLTVWSVAVVDEAIDALVEHFGKEDDDFHALSSVQRHRTSKQAGAPLL